MTKKSNGEKIFTVFNTIFLLGMIIITLYPFLYVVCASVSKPDLMIKHTGILLWPLGFNLSAYKAVLQNPMIASGYKNTIIYVLLGTTLNLLMTCLGAYVLSRKSFKLKKVLMMLIIFTMFFQGGLIPSYLLVKSMGMIDTAFAIVVPTAISTFNLIIMRTAFEEIPAAFEEAAKIDGANDFTILIKVFIPLAMPTIAVMILFYGVHHWNSWVPAMLYLRKREYYPLQLVLKEILISSNTQSMTTDVANSDVQSVSEIIKYATIVVATVPILFVYPFLQKYFVKGMMVGGVKG